jgi:hypothetical protein
MENEEGERDQLPAVQKNVLTNMFVAVYRKERSEDTGAWQHGYLQSNEVKAHEPKSESREKSREEDEDDDEEITNIIWYPVEK